MANRQTVGTGTKWEEENGYSRAVRVGNVIMVSGTLATDAEGNIAHVDSPYRQTIGALDKIERALQKLGATRRHVVRTTLFVTNMDASKEIGRAHAEFFREVMPACTMIGVSELASSLASVEVQVDAIVDD